MSWSPEVPFNALPPLPPEGIDLEPKVVLKATVAARTALATLAQAGQVLPNPNRTTSPSAPAVLHLADGTHSS